MMTAGKWFPGNMIFLTMDSYENTSSYSPMRQLCLCVLLVDLVSQDSLLCLQQMRL
jgi:hypothetical protein